MSYYEEVFLKELIKKKERRERGEFNGIPLCFDNYRDYVESIDKGVYYGLLSGTGNGKSKLVRYAFAYKPLEFSLMTGYPIKILYFALEDNKMQIYKNIAAHYLWERHSILISQKLLDSKEDPLPDKFVKILEEDTEFYKTFEENVYIFNDDTDPDAILARCEKMKKHFGEDFHYIVIIDNFANITEGNYRNRYEAVETLSREHIRLKLTKEYNFSVIAILQTDFDTEKFANRNSSNPQITAIEPSLGSLGDIKIISRDFHILWALFNPWRYNIMTYPNSKGWNIDALRNKFRSLIMLKNNLGGMAPRLGLFFEGNKEIFTELPGIEQVDELQRIYVKVIEEERKFKESRSQKSR